VPAEYQKNLFYFLLFREWSDADFPKQRKHYAEKTVDFVSGMERRGFPETTKTLCLFCFGNGATRISRNNENIMLKKQLILFREWSDANLPKQRKHYAAGLIWFR